MNPAGTWMGQRGSPPDAPGGTAGRSLRREGIAETTALTGRGRMMGGEVVQDEVALGALKARTPSMVVLSIFTFSRSVSPGRFLIAP
jgi:hypothetical protein